MAISHQKLSDFQTWLWSTSPQPVLLRFVRQVLQILFALAADMKEGQLSLRAMSLVYTTILSMVPLIAISFSVLKGLGAHNHIRPFLLGALEPLGDKKVEITDKVVGFVDNIQVGVLGAIGIVILLYTVVGMLQKIEVSFNYVWHVERIRSLSKRLRDYLSVLLVGPMLLLLSSAMTTSTQLDVVADKLAVLPGSGYLMALIGWVIPYLILALAFTFFYAFIPNTKVKLKAAFIGGLTTAFLWKFMGWMFAEFVANSSGRAAIYSAFATIIVFMVWIYLVWLVLLIGASISFYIQHPELRRIRHKHYRLSAAGKEVIALDMMVAIACRFKQGKTTCTSQLSEMIQQPQKALDQVSAALKDAGLIVAEHDTGAWLLAKPAEQISQYSILSAVRVPQSEETPELKRFQSYRHEIEQVLKRQFEHHTLKELADKAQ